jgi:hypothetical protein
MASIWICSPFYTKTACFSYPRRSGLAAKSTHLQAGFDQFGASEKKHTTILQNT